MTHFLYVGRFGHVKRNVGRDFLRHIEYRETPGEMVRAHRQKAITVRRIIGAAPWR